MTGRRSNLRHGDLDMSRRRSLELTRVQSGLGPSRQPCRLAPGENLTLAIGFALLSLAVGSPGGSLSFWRVGFWGNQPNYPFMPAKVQLK